MPDSRLTRRRLLVLAGLAYVGGCSSDTDRINRLVFGAVKKDPIYSWRPDWAIRVADQEFPLGSIYPEATARLSHVLRADVLPAGAQDDAIAVALSSGWTAVTRSGSLRYIKNIEKSELALHMFLNAHVAGADQWLYMDFNGMKA